MVELVTFITSQVIFVQCNICLCAMEFDLLIFFDLLNWSFLAVVRVSHHSASRFGGNEPELKQRVAE